MTEDEKKELQKWKAKERRALDLYVRRENEQARAQYWVTVYTERPPDHPRVKSMTPREMDKHAAGFRKEAARLQRLIDKHAATLVEARAKIAELEAKIPQPTVSEENVADVLEAAIRAELAQDPEWGTMVRVPGSNKLRLHAGGAVFVVRVDRAKVVPT